MKLAFTTLGCPAWDMDTIIKKAVEYGFDGVDFRGYKGQLKIYELPEFTSGAKATAKRFADAGLTVPCLSTSAQVCCITPEALAGQIEEIRRYADICGYFRTPFLRVFGGGFGDLSREKAIDAMVQSLGKIVDAVPLHGVQLLIETHDEWMASEHLATVMKAVNSKSVGILWDTHHPYRILGESPATTCKKLGKWIHNTHWKDSIAKPGTREGHELCLVGDGDIPLRDIMGSLKTIGYDGYLTLEWEKLWCPQIAEPEIAFPKYVQYMRKLLSDLQVL